MWWLLLGCTQALVAEVVIGVDVAGEAWDGQPGDLLGASVAVGWASAPGVPALRGFDTASEVPAVWVGEGGGAIYAAASDGRWWRDGVLSGEAAGNRWAAGPLGYAVAGADGWQLPETGVSVAVRGIAALAVGEQRVLAVVCDPACEVLAWSADGEALGMDVTTGEGGAVYEWQGTAWAGAPDESTPDGAGQACNEHGDCIAGEPGDHLGRAFGGGFVTGTFNKWVVPARARIVPLDGGEVYAMETGAEDQPLALGGDDASLWIGAPYHPNAGLPAGRVVAVTR